MNYDVFLAEKTGMWPWSELTTSGFQTLWYRWGIPICSKRKANGCCCFVEFQLLVIRWCCCTRYCIFFAFACSFVGSSWIWCCICFCTDWRHCKLQQMKEWQVLGRCSRELKCVDHVCMGLKFVLGELWSMKFAPHLSESWKVAGSCFKVCHCLRMEESQKMCLHHGRQGEMAFKPECVANWWRRWKWVCRHLVVSTAVAGVSVDELMNYPYESPFFWRPNHWVTRQNALCICLEIVWWRGFQDARRLQFPQVLEIRLVLRWHGLLNLTGFLPLTFLRYLLAIVAILVLGVASCSSWVKMVFQDPPGYGEIWRLYNIPNIPSNVPVGHLEARSLCFPIKENNVFSSHNLFGRDLSPKFYESRTSLFWF